LFLTIHDTLISFVATSTINRGGTVQVGVKIIYKSKTILSPKVNHSVSYSRSFIENNTGRIYQQGLINEYALGLLGQTNNGTASAMQTGSTGDGYLYSSTFRQGVVSAGRFIAGGSKGSTVSVKVSYSVNEVEVNDSTYLSRVLRLYEATSSSASITVTIM
jgi:hypothetical protein